MTKCVSHTNGRHSQVLKKVQPTHSTHRHPSRQSHDVNAGCAGGGWRHGGPHALRLGSISEHERLRYDAPAPHPTCWRVLCHPFEDTGVRCLCRCPNPIVAATPSLTRCDLPCVCIGHVGAKATTIYVLYGHTARGFQSYLPFSCHSCVCPSLVTL